MASKKTTALMLTGLLLVCLLISCSKSDEAPPPDTDASVREEKPEEPFVYEKEKYGVPEIFSEPRLQFAWKCPTDEEKTIWSIRVDGSNLRQAMDHELLYKKRLQKRWG